MPTGAGDLVLKRTPALLAWIVALGGYAEQAHAGAPVRWTPPAVSSDAYKASPAFSPDGRELVFMREPGKDFDIWYVERQPASAQGGADWGRPVRLPAPVNSPHAELMPRVLEDGRIYFGSDRPGGMGGNDAYVASPLPGGRWRVDNLGPAVNSSANDYEVEVSRDDKELVLVSDRDQRSHLYRFRKDKDGKWTGLGRVPAREDVFQVGPLLSPKADRLLFAQADTTGSGELFVADLAPGADRAWPPVCP